MLLALAALLVGSPARADVWGFVDDRGVAHFANEKLDDRYELFFRAATTPQLRPEAVPRPVGQVGAPPMPVGSAASAPPKLAAFFEVSTGYKAVRHLLRDSALQNNIDYELLKALIVTESGFDAHAVSPKGAVGLMQLIPPTAVRYGVKADAKKTVEQKLTDPKTNIQAGSRYLRDLMRLFPGRLDLAIAAYNAGEGAVLRYGRQIPPFKETQNYVATVMQLYSQLKPPQLIPQPASAAGRVRMELPGPAGSIPGRGNMVPQALPPPSLGQGVSDSTLALAP